MLAALTFTTSLMFALNDAPPPAGAESAAAAPESATAPAAAPTVTTTPAPVAALPASTAAAPAARKRLLVLDFRNDGVEPRTVLIIRDALTTHLSRMAALDVISTEDVRRSLDVEAAKAALGCNLESCMAEIANALGADYIVFGNIGSLGGLLVGDMSVLDAQSSRSLARESFEVRSVEDLPRGIREAGGRLVTTAGIAVDKPASGPSVLLLAGAGVTALGVACVATGAVFASGAYDIIRDKTSLDAVKDKAESDFGFNTGLWIAGAAVTAAGAGLMIFSMVE